MGGKSIFKLNREAIGTRCEAIKEFGVRGRAVAQLPTRSSCFQKKGNPDPTIILKSHKDNSKIFRANDATRSPLMILLSDLVVVSSNGIR